MTFVDNTGDTRAAGDDLGATLDGLQLKTGNLGLSAGNFATAMARAFTQAASGGKQFDDVLKSLALRLSNLAVTQAFKPLAGGLDQVLKGVFGGSTTAIQPFAAGGVIGAPGYFPLGDGGLGLAGEAGPEAIMPLTRGADGRLGIGMAGQATPANVTVHIAAPDAASFRRSEAYLTGQIARAVARGQRNL
jgi:phage-related minor tail protein